MMGKPPFPRPLSLPVLAGRLAIACVASWILIGAAFADRAIGVGTLLLPVGVLLFVLVLTLGLAVVVQGSARTLGSMLGMSTPAQGSRHVQSTTRQCQTCGYDLWATLDRCPECGGEPHWYPVPEDDANLGNRRTGCSPR